jgi:hypothetical protein
LKIGVGWDVEAPVLGGLFRSVAEQQFSRRGQLAQGDHFVFFGVEGQATFAARDFEQGRLRVHAILQAMAPADTAPARNRARAAASTVLPVVM